MRVKMRTLAAMAFFCIIVIGFIKTDDNLFFFAGELEKKEKRIQPVE
jgi:hypothetical protein